MRGGILGTGIALFIIAFIFYSIGTSMINNGQSTVDYYTSLNVNNLPLSQLLRTISSDAEYTYEKALESIQTGHTLSNLGIFFGIIGFVVCITGIVAPSKKKHCQQPTSDDYRYQQTAVISQKPLRGSSKHDTDRRCPECGRGIPFDALLCPFCGKRFKVFYSEEFDTRKEARRQLVGEQSFCPNCGERNYEKSKFCRNCGERIS